MGVSIRFYFLRLDCMISCKGNPNRDNDANSVGNDRENAWGDGHGPNPEAYRACQTADDLY